ncbi:MAG: Transcriptional regulator, AcrR family, partial [uncultured Rubrobacteraceae bacterium]
CTRRLWSFSASAGTRGSRRRRWPSAPGLRSAPSSAILRTSGRCSSTATNWEVFSPPRSPTPRRGWRPSRRSSPASRPWPPCSRTVARRWRDGRGSSRRTRSSGSGSWRSSRPGRRRWKASWSGGAYRNPTRCSWPRSPLRSSASRTGAGSTGGPRASSPRSSAKPSPAWAVCSPIPRRGRGTFPPHERGPPPVAATG